VSAVVKISIFIASRSSFMMLSAALPSRAPASAKSMHGWPHDHQLFITMIAIAGVQFEVPEAVRRGEYRPLRHSSGGDMTDDPST
jgi:hypothetical protein